MTIDGNCAFNLAREAVGQDSEFFTCKNVDCGGSADRLGIEIVVEDCLLRSVVALEPTAPDQAE